MRRTTRVTIICILMISTVFSTYQTTKAEEEKIIVEYFYGEFCDTCNETKPIMDLIEQKYDNLINLTRYTVEDDPETENYQKMVDHYNFQQYPAVVVLNQTSQSITKITYEEITFDNLVLIIDQYLTGEYVQEQGDLGEQIGNQEEEQIDPDNTINAILILVIIVIVLIILIFIKKKSK